jgi:transposase
VGSLSTLPLDLELQARLKDRLSQTEFEQVAEAFHKVELENRYLRELLRLERIAKYGPASEHLSDDQLELLELEPGVSEAEIQAEAERTQLRLPLRKASANKQTGRQELPAHLPRIEETISCTPEQCVCAKCGKEKALIGFEQSEQLDVEPAKYFVRVIKREKRACRSCDQAGVSCAPLAPKIIDKCLASNRLVVDVVVNKYCDHLPLYRQSEILEREFGIEVPRVTLCSWVMKVGFLLQAVSAAMRQELLAGDYIQADETPVGVQTHDGRGKNHQAYLWQYSRPFGAVVFEFQMHRSREGPRKFLKHYNGLLQTDGYAAYDRVGGPQMVHTGCWSHARRYFFQALQAHPQDRAAAAIVAQIDQLFELEADAKRLGYDLEQRLELRRRRSAPLLETIRAQIQTARQNALPKSSLAKACDYTLTLWSRLIRFLDHPVLELSNNWAENAIRPVALGRKNWLHIGSEEAGPRVAAVLSIIQTCRRNQIPVRDYLNAILPGLADLPVNRVAELTPLAWRARQS